MLFKLSVSNIRKSLRDYAIYFFTLIIGVSVFYVFNAIGGQAAMLETMENSSDVVGLLSVMLSGVSVFVAGILGLLIVYASRFLMKRRNKEFALYLMLGMSKGKISAILLIETLFIGLGSLSVGIIVGIGLSQLMSALVANLFEADMTAYKFTVSGEAIVKTIACFAVMYLVVMVFNSVIISRCKLIDLMQSGKKSERIRLKNPVFCVVIFLLAAVLLGYAYYQVVWGDGLLDEKTFLTSFAMGSLATLLIFWSVSGMLLRVVMSMKNAYYRSLNCFTFRQISSKVNTTVLSMTVICLMLFLTICILSAALSLRGSMNRNVRQLCPADFETSVITDTPGSHAADIPAGYAEMGIDIHAELEESVSFCTYADPDFTYETYLGESCEEIEAKFPSVLFKTPETLVRLSDYNALSALYDREPLTLGDDEYILLSNFIYSKEMRDIAIADIEVFGQTLHPAYPESQDGFIDLSIQAENTGIFVIPDDAADENCIEGTYLIGNFRGDTADAETRIRNATESQEKLYALFSPGSDGQEGYVNIRTKPEMASGMVGLTAIVVFLGLYLGLIFLISCGAILALKELSENADSISRYEILRKIGVEEEDISRSLFRQTGIFFLLPLLLACVHSVFGLKFALKTLSIFGLNDLTGPVALTSLFIILIYGGYFLITYVCSKGIIKGRS